MYLPRRRKLSEIYENSQRATFGPSKGSNSGPSKEITRREGPGSLYHEALKSIRQLTNLQNSLKSARIAIIRDGEHHDENADLLRQKAPSHAYGFTHSVELGATSSSVIETLMVVANEEFEAYLENLSPTLKSRLQKIMQEPRLGPDPTASTKMAPRDRDSRTPTEPEPPTEARDKDSRTVA